jgi:hypothetical protein
MATTELEEILNLAPGLLKILYSRICTTYDEETDILFINFKKLAR